MKRLLFIVLVFVALPSAQASDQNRAFYALTSISCGALVNDRATDPGRYYGDKVFVAGFITAFNDVLPATYNVLGNGDLASAMVWLDNYCRAHPLNQITSGLDSLINELMHKRGHSTQQHGQR